MVVARKVILSEQIGREKKRRGRVYEISTGSRNGALGDERKASMVDSVPATQAWNKSSFPHAIRT